MKHYKKQFYILTASVLACFTVYKIVHLAGGTHSPYPHLFYFPIMFASFFGSWTVSLFTAVLSSLMMSYWFMPLNIPYGVLQGHFGWTYRAFMFMTVSVFIKVTTCLMQRNHNLLLKKSRQLTLLSRSTLNAILDLAETKDPDSTGKHLDRLAAYARILLAHIDLPADEKQNIIYSIAFHDIGKVAIPDSILLKPGKLTEEEFETMKSHTTIGGDILRKIQESVSTEERELGSMLRTATELTYYHHERTDGKGYPFGLSADEIPLSAKITALCDVYDALSTWRPYKEAFPHKKCVEIIREGRGTQFDEAIVDCFLKVEREFEAIARRIADLPDEDTRITG